VRRQEAQANAKALHDAGLVPLHEPMNYGHIQGGSDIDPEGSEEQQLVQKDFGSDEEAYEKATAVAATQKVQFVSHQTAGQLHK
jgi:hypothetical protein